MTAAVDPIDAVRAVLLADNDAAALVGTNVWGGEVPESESKTMPVASIVVKPAGGPPSAGYTQFGKSRVDVVCFGATIHDAHKVYLAAYGALSSLSRVVSQGVLLHSAECTSKGSTARDPVKQWPTSYSSWLVLASEITAA